MFTMPLASMSYEEKMATDHGQGGFDKAPRADILGALEELHRLVYVHRDLNQKQEDRPLERLHGLSGGLDRTPSG
jgi:hypothetical protein